MSDIIGLEPPSIHIIILKWEANGKSINVVSVIKEEEVKQAKLVVTRVTGAAEDEIIKVVEVVITRVAVGTAASVAFGVLLGVVASRAIFSQGSDLSYYYY